MNRILLVLFAFLLAPNVLAQSYAIDKGSYLLGGTASFSSQGTTISLEDGFGNNIESNDRLIEGTFNVSFGYFVTPGLSLGVDSQYQRVWQDGGSQTTTSVGPSIAYYFGQPTSTVYPFVSANAGLSTVSVNVDNAGSSSSTGYRVGAAGGLSYMIARNIALTGALFYQRESFDYESASLTNGSFGFQGGVTAFIF